MSTTQIVSPSRIRELFDYDHTIGKLVRRVRVNNHATGNVIQGSLRKGYLKLNIDEHRYLYHRVVWAHQKGEWPTSIDHINRVKTDNRIENLREATTSQNAQNRVAFSNNTSGYKGVTRERGAWRAVIRLNNRKFHLGNFASFDDAVAMHQGAQSLLHSHRPMV